MPPAQVRGPPADAGLARRRAAMVARGLAAGRDRADHTVRRTSMSLISLIASAGFSPFETKKPRG